MAGNNATNGNTNGPDVKTVASPIESLGHNLVGKTDGGTGWVASDLTGTIAAPLSPGLASLSSNGGLTQTIALLPSGPAINAGDSGFSPLADQRGELRS